MGSLACVNFNRFCVLGCLLFCASYARGAAFAGADTSLGQLIRKVNRSKSQGSATSNDASSSSGNGPSDFRFFFITDCSAHQKWMAFNVFNSAKKVGQTGRITWARSGCPQSEVQRSQKADVHSHGAAMLALTSSGRAETVRKKGSDARTDAASMAQALYPEAEVLHLDGDAPPGEQIFNMGFGVPKAVNNFLQTHEDLPNSTVLALIEADFVFLTQLRLEELEAKGMLADGHTLMRDHSHGDSLVGGRVGIAQHYQCCDDLGPPYILSLAGWRELAPRWNQKTTKGGWGADQVAFAEAAKDAGLRFNVFDHFMVSDLKTAGEGWSLVDESLSSDKGNVCLTKKFGVGRGTSEAQSGPDRLPTFMHIVRPWKVNEGGANESATWGFSKYQVPPGWRVPQKTDGMLECGMPMFAEPSADLLEIVKRSDKQSIQDGTRSAWAICTIVHSLNDMLFNYKKAKCPEGFNQVKAVKMQVPLSWTNDLLPGADAGAPKGTDLEWMHECATRPKC